MKGSSRKHKDVPRVFICYPHKDAVPLIEGEKLEVVERMGEALRAAGIDSWSDGALKLGERWSDGIQRALEEANVAIVFLSNASFVSDFITRLELPKLQNKRLVIPVKIYEVANKQHWLHARTEPPSPLAEMKISECFRLFMSIANRISEEFGAPDERLVPVHAQAYKPDGAPTSVENLLSQYFDLVRTYDDSKARALASAFSGEGLHGDIVALLREGLRDVPLVHPGVINKDTLLAVDGYARLLHGIQLMNKTWEGARNKLESLDHSKFTYCPLRSYALSQCARKIKTWQGKASWELLKDAAEYLRTGADEESCTRCGDKVRCSKRLLSIQIRRGLAVVYRDSGRTEEADREFALAFKLADDPGVDKHIKANVAYSWGYLDLERAGKAAGLGSSGGSFASNLEPVQAYLRNALERFEFANDAYPEWPAPKSRAAIARQLDRVARISTASSPVTTDDDTVVDYLQARRRATTLGDEGEHALTAVLAGLGAAMLDTDYRENEAKKLTRELAGLLLRRDPGKKPRECHAFDAELVWQAGIVTHPEAATDRWLLRLHSLLTSCGRWDLGSDRGARLATLQGWCDESGITSDDRQTLLRRPDGSE